MNGAQGKNRAGLGSRDLAGLPSRKRIPRKKISALKNPLAREKNPRQSA